MEGISGQHRAWSRQTKNLLEALQKLLKPKSGLQITQTCKKSSQANPGPTQGHKVPLRAVRCPLRPTDYPPGPKEVLLNLKKALSVQIMNPSTHRKGILDRKGPLGLFRPTERPLRRDIGPPGPTQGSLRPTEGPFIRK